MSSPTKKRKRQSSPSQALIHHYFAPRSSQPPAAPAIEQDIIDVDAVSDSSFLEPSQPSESKLRFQVLPFSAVNVANETPAYPDLSVDPVTYEVIPSPWPSSAVPYSFLAHTFVTLSKTRSRILIINALTNALRTILVRDPSSLLPAVYLLSNSLAPPYVPVELGLGPSVISRALQHVSGQSASALRKMYNNHGDVGDVAFHAKSNVRTLVPHPSLSVQGVHSSLRKIAQANGTGAAKEKQRIVEKLLLSATGEEVRYITRTLSQNLRVGAVRTSILTALARAFVLAPPSSISLATQSNYHASQELLAKARRKAGKQKADDSVQGELAALFSRAEGLIKRVYVQHPNYDDIIAVLTHYGLNGLEKAVSLAVGIPLHPTLGSPTRSLDEIYEHLDNRPFTAEFKYDGQRAQIHASREGDNISVSIFSRHLEDMTSKYPDVVGLVNHFLEIDSSLSSFIMDSEIVAIDSASGALKSFQELSNRARKNVSLREIKVSICVYGFDLMYLDGEVLLEHTFRERRALLRSRFPDGLAIPKDFARFYHVESCESDVGRVALETFWTKAASQCEGLMIKLLDHEDHESLTDKGARNGKGRKKPLLATYEPDKRTFSWLKLKKDYVAGLGDSLDLVPIGAWHGNGRKAQWWSPILLGIWDPDSGGHVAVCKCMSGFSDEFYIEMRKRYPNSEDSDTCSTQPIWGSEMGGFRPDVYFKPMEVWEIRGADITLSPVSIAAKGLITESRGLSLRFPRFVRVRNDKGFEDASTAESLTRIWYSQQSKADVNADANGEEGLQDELISDDEIP